MTIRQSLSRISTEILNTVIHAETNAITANLLISLDLLMVKRHNPNCRVRFGPRWLIITNGAFPFLIQTFYPT